MSPAVREPTANNRRPQRGSAVTSGRLYDHLVADFERDLLEAMNLVAETGRPRPVGEDLRPEIHLLLSALRNLSHCLRRVEDAGPQHHTLETQLAAASDTCGLYDAALLDRTESSDEGSRLTRELDDRCGGEEHLPIAFSTGDVFMGTTSLRFILGGPPTSSGPLEPETWGSLSASRVVSRQPRRRGLRPRSTGHPPG